MSNLAWTGGNPLVSLGCVTVLMTVMQDYYWIFWNLVGSWNNLTSFDCLCYRKENNMNLYYNSNTKPFTF